MSKRLNVTLLTREPCPLCDEAEQIIIQMQQEFSFVFERKNVDEDPDLLQTYGHTVPVVFINDVPLFYGKVSKIRLRNFLRQGAQRKALDVSKRYRLYLERMKTWLAENRGPRDE